MKKERFRGKLKLFKNFLILVLLLIGIPIATLIVYNVVYGNEVRHEEIEKMYESEKQRHELLRIIANHSIDEGNEIKVSEISRVEGIEYKIYNSGEKIIVYYQINDEGNLDKSNLASATITLSNDFKILSKEYSELQDFEEYKKHTEDLWKLCSVLIVVLAVTGLGITYTVLRCGYSLYKDYKKR